MPITWYCWEHYDSNDICFYVELELLHDVALR